jgi:hypothetical protein
LRSEVGVKIECNSKFTISSITLSLLLFAITLIVSGFIILFIPNNVQTASAAYELQRMWGTNGSGNGQFVGPNGVAVDASGNVFVVDSYNHRIQKFRISSPCPTGTTQVVSGVCFVTKWGTLGSGNGLFKFPYGVAVDSSGNVFVAEYGNNRIQKFTNQGDFIRKWGMLGTGPGKFKQPVDLDVSNPGILVFKENTYVADFLNNRIQVFTWKPDVQPTTNLNLNLKGSLQNNNNLLLLVNNQDTISISNCREEKS